MGIFGLRADLRFVNRMADIRDIDETYWTIKALKYGAAMAQYEIASFGRELSWRC